MDIQTFRKKLDDLGFPNEVSSPDPTQEFTTAKFGTLLCHDDGPELEIKLPANRVRSIAVEDIERWNEQMAQAYLNRLGRK
jgi:hypothetical protein